MTTTRRIQGQKPDPEKNVINSDFNVYLESERDNNGAVVNQFYSLTMEVTKTCIPLVITLCRVKLLCRCFSPKHDELSRSSNDIVAGV